MTAAWLITAGLVWALALGLDWLLFARLLRSPPLRASLSILAAALALYAIGRWGIGVRGMGYLYAFPGFLGALALQWGWAAHLRRRAPPDTDA